MSSKQNFTFSKKTKSQSDINEFNLSNRTNYSKTLSISNKPSISTLFLEKTIYNVKKNLEENNHLINTLFSKIGMLKNNVKFFGPEWNRLQAIELELIDQIDKQEKNINKLQELHNKNRKIPMDDITQQFPLIDERAILNLISQYNTELSELSELSELKNNTNQFFAPKKITSYQDIITQDAIGDELKKFNANLNDSYHLSKQYVNDTFSTVRNRLLVIEETYHTEIAINLLNNKIKKKKNEVDTLLNNLNNDVLNLHNDENTTSNITKCLLEFKKYSLKVEHLNSYIKKTENLEYLEDVQKHFDQHKVIDTNNLAIEKDSKEFIIINELSNSHHKLNALISQSKSKFKNQTLPSEITFPFTSKDRVNYLQNIESRFDKLFNLIYQQIKIELKNEEKLYSGQSSYLTKIIQLKNDISAMEEELSNYILENTTLTNKNNIQKNLNELTTQFSDELIKTKILLKFVNLELKNTLQLSSSSHAMNATYNGLDEINSNIYMLAVEKKLLKNEIRRSISNIHMQVPPKSTASPISEEAYIKSIQNRMHTVLRLIELKEQLVETYKLQKLTELPEYINNLYSVEKQISNVKTDISLYINEHSENKGTNSIFSDITPLLTEISNKKTKIISIEKMIGEKLAKTNADFINIDENDKDLASLLSSIMAEFQQDTMANEINYQPSHNNPATIFTMLRE